MKWTDRSSVPREKWDDSKVDMAEAVSTVFVNGLVKLKKAVFLCIILKEVKLQNEYRGEMIIMAFIKVKDKKTKEDTIINTNMICRISRNKNGYTVFFSSGNVGAAYYEYDEDNAKKIFDAIGVSL